MKRALLASLIVVLLGCEDSGPVPFTGKNLWGQGGSGAVPGNGGSGGGSSGSGGSGGSSGSSSCYGQCGSSQQQPSGCYCDTQCESEGDCCNDYYSYCQGAGGMGGGGSCTTKLKYNSPTCDVCMRGSCCPIVQACDIGTSCYDVDQCRFSYCTQAGDIYSCMQSYCSGYGSGALETWYSYWNCMQSYCSYDCAG